MGLNQISVSEMSRPCHGAHSGVRYPGSQTRFESLEWCALPAHVRILLTHSGVRYPCYLSAHVWILRTIPESDIRVQEPGCHFVRPSEASKQARAGTSRKASKQGLVRAGKQARASTYENRVQEPGARFGNQASKDANGPMEAGSWTRFSKRDCRNPLPPKSIQRFLLVSAGSGTCKRGKMAHLRPTGTTVCQHRNPDHYNLSTPLVTPCSASE